MPSTETLAVLEAIFAKLRLLALPSLFRSAPQRRAITLVWIAFCLAGLPTAEEFVNKTQRLVHYLELLFVISRSYIID